MKKEEGLAILKRSSLYRGNISGHKFEGGAGRKQGGHFLYTLSTFTLTQR